MKHWSWYLAALLLVAALGGKPFAGTDAAKLQPVQVVQVLVENDLVLVQTDTGDSGAGRTLALAFDQLEQTTPGYVFLDTAQYLLVQEEAKALLPQLCAYLRPGCGVCAVTAEADLKAVAKYLSAHPLPVSLRTWRAGEKDLPRLVVNGEGRMLLA